MGKFIDMKGKKFEMLTVLERYGTAEDRQALWKCKCDCGNTQIVKGRNLRKGVVKTCGCKSIELTAKSHIKHGMSGSKLYGIWLSMKNRCYLTSDKGYENYGGRGIKICNEWLDFKSFMEWSYSNGYDEKAHRGKCTLDRINVNGDYSPSNCRWVDARVQANNRRNNDMIECNGEIHSLSEWARITGVKRATLWARLYVYKWDIEKALRR